MIVTSLPGLEALCRELRRAGSFAIDTEFVRERTYFIRLGILQVATRETEAIVDPHGIESLAPLYELVGTSDVEKVVHAGEQDFAILFERMGRSPRNVFDTQIAAALVGYGEQLSYARLVQKIKGIRLSKLETLTDWTARPLTHAQIDYALEDVRHLPPLREHLGQRLQELGRHGWAKEEFLHLEDEATYAHPEPRRVFHRIKQRGLGPRQLGVLREIAAWREEEAMRRDLPRRWVLRDQTLLQIARRRPDSLEDLHHIRALKLPELERSGGAILDAVRRGAAHPVEDVAVHPTDHGDRARVKSLLRLLEAWVHACAGRARVAPSMLASKEQLRALAGGYLAREIPELAVLNGWRRELVGEDLLGLLSGRLRLQVQPETGELALVAACGPSES